MGCGPGDPTLQYLFKSTVRTAGSSAAAIAPLPFGISVAFGLSPCSGGTWQSTCLLSFSVCTSALQNSIPFLLEHPEDLGTTADGHTPASIWQLPEAVALFKHENVMTFAIYQCQYGASTPKPTRFLSSIAFDSSDKYLGPLPKYCGHYHKQRLLGSVNTSTSAAYPADLCKAIATWTFSVFDGGGALSRPLAQASEARFQFPARDVVASPEADPAEHLAAECLRNGRISQDQLLHMSELLPDEDRVRRADKPVEGQCSFTSGAYVHSDRTGLRRNTRIFPLSTELLARLISCSFPDRPFTSLALFRDLKQPPHRDSTNGPFDNLLLACSGFSGGGLWVEFEGGSVQRLINGTWLSGTAASFPSIHIGGTALRTGRAAA